MNDFQIWPKNISSFPITKKDIQNNHLIYRTILLRAFVNHVIEFEECNFQNYYIENKSKFIFDKDEKLNESKSQSALVFATLKNLSIEGIESNELNNLIINNLSNIVIKLSAYLNDKDQFARGLKNNSEYGLGIK